MADFLHMGGYAAYVWPAYAVSALGLGGLVFAIWRRGRDLARRLDAAQKRLETPDNDIGRDPRTP